VDCDARAAATPRGTAVDLGGGTALTCPNDDLRPPGANRFRRRPPAPDLRKETFCHAGERKSPRVTEEGPETPPETSSETFASASRSSSSSELSSAKAQKRDPPAARRSGRGECGERGRGGNTGARAGEGIASATPQEGDEGEPTVIFSVPVCSLAFIQVCVNPPAKHLCQTPLPNKALWVSTIHRVFFTLILIYNV
jgi:hypothetical protein